MLSIAGHKNSNVTLVWDDTDLSEARDLVEGTVSQEEEDLETSDEESGTVQFFLLFDKDFDVKTNKLQICENILDLNRVQEFVVAHRQALVRVEITWQGLRDVLQAKLEEMQLIEKQFYAFKRAVKNKKVEFQFSEVDLFDINVIVINKRNAVKKTYKHFLKSEASESQREWMKSIVVDFYKSYDAWDATLLVFSRWLGIRPPVYLATRSTATSRVSLVDRVDKNRVQRREHLKFAPVLSSVEPPPPPPPVSEPPRGCLLYTSDAADE